MRSVLFAGIMIACTLLGCRQASHHRLPSSLSTSCWHAWPRALSSGRQTASVSSPPFWDGGCAGGRHSSLAPQRPEGRAGSAPNPSPRLRSKADWARAIDQMLSQHIHGDQASSSMHLALATVQIQQEKVIVFPLSICVAAQMLILFLQTGSPVYGLRIPPEWLLRRVREKGKHMNRYMIVIPAQ